MTKKTYSTKAAAAKIGVSFRTLNRWLADGLIRPAMGIPMAGGHTFWRWTDADVLTGRKVKAMQKPGPRPQKAKRR